MLRFWILLFVCIYSFCIAAQENGDTQLKNNDSTKNTICFDYNERTEKFSYNLDYTAKYFAELNGYKIEVRRKKITTMMAARPKRNFVFHSKETRRYVLLITDKYNMNADTIYSALDSSAIRSILAHELSHIVSYKNKTNAELFLFGIKYVLNRSKIEYETDMIAIEHGFGAGLVEYTNYINRSPLTNKKYLLRKKKYYLSSNELESRIQEIH
jgi:hypothetical protein